MNVAEFIVNDLATYGVKHCFSVVGGHSIFLNHAFEKSDIKVIYMHHEQACAMAAEGYFKATGKMAAVCVTAGPGTTNTMTGLFGNYVDSVPVFYISGQCRTDTLKYSNEMRQRGDQEVDTEAIVKPLVKRYVCIDEGSESSISAEIFLNMKTATDGRFGPVWMQVPIDIQSSKIDMRYQGIESAYHESEKPEIFEGSVQRVYKAMKSAKRPLIIVGHGVKLSGGQKSLKKLLARWQIPFLVTFNGFDCVETSTKLNFGAFGSCGSRVGNYILQNADTILFLGTRNNIRQTGYNTDNFAHDAYKICVDIDKEEIKKIPMDDSIHGDVKEVIDLLLEANTKIPRSTEWTKYCNSMFFKYAGEHTADDRRNLLADNKINPYFFIGKLSDAYFKEHDIIVCGNATSCTAAYQSAQVRKGQKWIWNSGCGSMGYSLPAAIGAAVGSGKTVVCIDGDGSFMMNMQEMATVKKYKLPIITFVLNNRGYSSIRQTQDKLFAGEKSGWGYDNFDIKAILPLCPEITKNNLLTYLPDVFKHGEGSTFLVEVGHKEFYPKVSTEMVNGRLVSGSLSNMYPFLPEEEMKKNMEISEAK